MTSLAHGEPAWKVVPISSDLRNEMLDGALRELALHIQDKRTQRLELTPNQAVHMETLRHLDCGMLLSEDQIELTTDVGCFREGDVGFCVEPRRLTLWGQASSGSGGTDPHDLIFRFVNLPFEIEEETVSTKRKGRVLTIKMRRRLAPGTKLIVS